MENKKRVLTTADGQVVENDIASVTLQGRSNKFTLLEDKHLVEKLAHFVRERIPERVVHAKGAGAHGYFEVTNDMSKYTKAKLFNKVGTKTDLFIRFSTVGGESGSADSARDPRGFAIKFYTEDGNYDMVGNATPIFFLRDAMKFPDFIHTQKRDPHTHLKDPNMMWDFWSLTPESLHQVTILMSDRGTPVSYRFVHGYSSHAFMWYTSETDYVWVKYHFKSNQGIKNWTSQESIELAGKNPDFSIQDLFEAIQNKDYPSWTMYVQIMTQQQADELEYDPFDVTKVWYQKDFPLIEVGKMVLNRNPENYFAEVEQVALSPARFVPGIAASPDKMLQGRLFAYEDAHRYRLGANYQQLPINRPKNQVNTNQRDGAMVYDNQGSTPNYYPSTLPGHTVVAKEYDKVPQLPISDTKKGRFEYELTDIDFVQPGILYDRILDDGAKARLVENIVSTLGLTYKEIQYRQTALFYKASKHYGEAVAKKLNLDLNKVIELAKLTQEQRVQATLIKQ